MDLGNETFFVEETSLASYPALSQENLKKRLFKRLNNKGIDCLLYTSPSPRDLSTSRMPSSA